MAVALVALTIGVVIVYLKNKKENRLIRLQIQQQRQQQQRNNNNMRYLSQPYLAHIKHNQLHPNQMYSSNYGLTSMSMQSLYSNNSRVQPSAPPAPINDSNKLRSYEDLFGKNAI